MRKKSASRVKLAKAILGMPGLLFLFLLTLFVPVCCLAQEETGVQDEGKVLIVYYSRTDHTHLVAQKLAERFNADLERLNDKRKRSGPIGYARAGKDAIAGNTTELEPLVHDPQEYDIILIGTPTWASHMTPAVRTFILENDLSGKTIGLFGVCQFSGVKDTLNEVAVLIGRGRNRKFPLLPLRQNQLKGKGLDDKIDAFYLEVQEAR